jgi:hypothetical protein
MTEAFYNSTIGELANLYPSLPSGLKSFINESELVNVIDEIRNNTSGYMSFRKRYFGWFNMFRVVKYLNFVHKTHFAKVEVEKAASELLEIIRGGNNLANPVDLLNYYRSLEKEC